MPLTSMVASLVCVVAAIVMLGAARGSASRAAHAVVLGVMLVLALGMPSLFVSSCCAVVLVTTVGLLLRRRPDAEARMCALDIAACAALVALMGASSLIGAAGSSDGMDMSGMHANGPDDPVLSVVLVGATFLLVAGWALARRRVRPVPGAGGVAAWLMMLGMLAMVTA